MDFASDFIRLGSTDATALREQTAALPEAAWQTTTTRQERFPVHQHTQSIPLIFDPDYRHANPTYHAYYDVFAPVLAPVIRLIADHYTRQYAGVPASDRQPEGYPVRMLLARLFPKAIVAPHRDRGYSLENAHRIHLPIITNDRVVFRVGTTQRHLKEGELWEINNCRMHAVSNLGEEPRIHLIVDWVEPA